MLKVHIPEDICFESNDKNNSICIFKDSLNHVKNITKMVASFLNINMTQMDAMGLVHTNPGSLNIPNMVGLSINHGEKIVIPRHRKPVTTSIMHKKVRVHFFFPLKVKTNKIWFKNLIMEISTIFLDLKNKNQVSIFDRMKNQIVEENVCTGIWIHTVGLILGVYWTHTPAIIMSQYVSAIILQTLGFSWIIQAWPIHSTLSWITSQVATILEVHKRGAPCNNFIKYS